MPIDFSNIEQISEDIIRDTKAKLPNAELYELGGILLSLGSFLVASAIPEMWPQLRNTALLSQELLNQEKMKQKFDSLNPKPETSNT